jgi:hypothetical protein
MGTGTNQEVWKNNGMVYFKAMSRAFASSCKGTVWVMTDSPSAVMKQIPEYASTPSIWLEDEVPELKELYKAGIITDVRAIVYGRNMFSPPSRDVTDLVFGSRTAKRTPEEDRKMAEAIVRQKQVAAEKAIAIMAGEWNERAENGTDKRALFCTDSYLQENPDADYFG